MDRTGARTEGGTDKAVPPGAAVAETRGLPVAVPVLLPAQLEDPSPVAAVSDDTTSAATDDEQEEAEVDATA